MSSTRHLPDLHRRHPFRFHRHPDADHRAHPRITRDQFPARIDARVKYGGTVTLLDLSSGGALLETTRAIRPDTDLVLELTDRARSEVNVVASRVLRSHVESLKDGPIYRGACRFKRPFAHPALERFVVPPPARPERAADDRVRIEFALKTIVDGCFRRSSSGTIGNWRDGATLVDALLRLRDAAERRTDDRALARLLDAVVPAIREGAPADAIVRGLHEELARALPLLAIRLGGDRQPGEAGREAITVPVCGESGLARMDVTAELSCDFSLDASQLRLLKAGAYLAGLARHWRPASKPPARHAAPPTPIVDACTSTSSSATPRAVQDAPGSPQSPPAASAEPSPAPAPAVLPAGWHRVIVRCLDGRRVRGYMSGFQRDASHLPVCPAIACTSDERQLVPFDHVKAVFFVRDFGGNPRRVKQRAFDRDPRARKIEVTFRDGEILLGSTLTYRANARGFFLDPADSQGNNLRVFVVQAATRLVRFV